MKPWMEKVNKRFKNAVDMIPTKFLYGIFIDLPVDIDFKDLKKLSKGKRRRTPTYGNRSPELLT